jgi:hypothetical protein
MKPAIQAYFDLSSDCPFFVSRYFCLLLRGLSGMVISIHPLWRAG